MDGFIAKADGGLEWLDSIPNPEKSDFGYKDFIESIDAIVLGKNTFEKVLSFDHWPYEKKVFVLSHSLKSIPDTLSGKVEIEKGDVPSIVSRLNKKGFTSLYIDGGKTIQLFLKNDLIDEMIITKVSVLLGDGIPLFSNLKIPLEFTVKSTKKLNPMLVQTHYLRNRN